MLRAAHLLRPHRPNGVAARGVPPGLGLHPGTDPGWRAGLRLGWRGACRALAGLGVVLALGTGLGLGLAASPARACNCFSPELQERTGRETLALARLAAFVEVRAVAADGSARVQVLEAWKGVEPGAALSLSAPEAGGCAATVPALQPGERALVLAFGPEPPRACERYAPEHFLLSVFRRLPPPASAAAPASAPSAAPAAPAAAASPATPAAPAR